MHAPEHVHILQISAYFLRMRKVSLALESIKNAVCNKQNILGRTHGAPYRGYGYVPLKLAGGTSLGEWEHNNNKQNIVDSKVDIIDCKE